MKPVLLRLLFAVNTFAAAMLALYLSFSIGLDRPYWAMATTYIVSQPYAGALRSKGLYRLIGTLAGGAAAVVLLPLFGQAPELLCLALALWVGLCLYVSLLDRTPRSYVFILAGYTAAIIGFPTAPHPEVVFEVAVARVEEIGLGVVCATLVHSLVLPQGLGPVLVERIGCWLRDAQSWTIEVLDGRPAPEREAARRRLAADATEIRILSTHLPFDTSNFRDTRRVLTALQDRMILAVPLISALGDRLEALRALGGAPEPLAPRLEALSRWVGDSQAAPEEGRRAAEGLAAAQAELEPPRSWPELLAVNVADRARSLVEAVQAIRDLRAALAAGARRPPAGLVDRERERGGGLGLYRDRTLAFLSAQAAILAVLVCCVLWIGLGWAEGALAAMNAAVFCSFFATQDDPAPAISSFLWFTVATLPLVALYQFAILPAVDGFPMLVLVLAPAMIAVGYAVADPRFTSRAMPVALGISNGLALAETFSPDFAGFANGNVAQVVGLVAALLITRLVRSVGAEWSARRILRSGWRELARLAAAPGPADRPRFILGMVDRAGLLLSRLAVAETDTSMGAGSALGEIRVGLNVDDLQRARAQEAGTPGAAAIGRVLSGVAGFYRGLRAPDAVDLSAPTPEPPSRLLEEVDGAIGVCATAPADAPLRRALFALVGLRRSLFPGAPPYAVQGDAS